MRVVKDPDVRKQEILDGAIRVFAKKGYDKTTTSDIANELQISQGLCYRYFPTKEAIYDAALEKYADYIAQGNMQKVNHELPIRELIEQVTSGTDELTEVESRDKDLYVLFHSENSQRMHQELFLKVAKKVVPFVQESLRKAKEKGEIKTEDTDGAAIYGIYGMVGLYLTEDLSDQERMKKMRLAWYKLLELSEL